MTHCHFVSRRLFVAVAVVVCTAVHAASVAPVGGEHGMVVTAHQLATKVGVDVLKRGGNAVDAAVAVGYAMAVVYPAAGNLGGGGFMTIQLADGRKTFLDFRESAPLAATPNMYLDSAGNVVKGASTKGHLAVGVPPMLVHDHTEVLECEPPRRLVLKAKARPMGTARVELRLAADGPGTKVTMVEEAGDLASRLLLNPLTDPLVHLRNVESLRRLRELAERPA